MHSDIFFNSFLNYLENTSEEELQKEWDKYKEYDKIGPAVNNFINTLNTAKNPCTFCDPAMPNLKKDYTLLICKNHNMLINVGGYDYRNFDIYVRYCPICGRKLK